MSAIWGMINSSARNIEECKNSMCSSMEQFKIEKVEGVCKETSFFYCGHQYFNPEAFSDKSPIEDEKVGVVFTGDCYLYNRDEVIDYLVNQSSNMTSDKFLNKGDVELSFDVYKLCGNSFVDVIHGSFAFSIFDMNSGILELITDHVGQRSIFIYKNENVILFASALQPILAVIGRENVKINEQWIATAYSDCSADTVKVPEITVFEGIRQIAPATIVSIDINSNVENSICYWNPIRSVKTFHGTDEECKAKFISTFEKATEGMARALNNTGVTLSGGLDSSTVAAFLARKLQRENKQLFSYTSVPVKEFEYENNWMKTENESQYIYDQQKMYSNIVPRFIDYGTKNAFTDIKEFVPYYCQPIKPVLNLPLIDSIDKAACEDGCSLIFSGQNGNATISYGRIFTYVYQMICSGHFIKAYNQMKIFCKKFRVSKKKFIKLYLNSYKESVLFPDYMGDSNFIKNELVNKYNVRKILKETHKRRGTGEIDSKKQRKNFCYMPEVFQHMGYFNTYSSLHYGILELDPTLSKPVIEMCMSMPIEYFVKDGIERRAVRDYMRGYVADSVLDNIAARGAQAADYVFVVNRDWDKIGEDVYRNLGSEKLRKYMDDKSLDQLISRIKENESNLDGDMVAKAAVLSSLSIFLEEFA